MMAQQFSNLKTSALRASKLFVGLLPIILALLFWEILGSDHNPRFPKPSVWVERLNTLWAEGGLAEAVLETTLNFFAALIISLLLGTLLGILVGSNRIVDRATGPFFEFLRVIPPPAIVPIALLIVGSTSSMTIAVTVFAAIWPILLSTSAAVRSIPQIRLDTIKTLSMSRAEGLRKIIFPSLVPGIALGIRIATPLTLVVVIVAEMLGSTGGVGLMLLQSQRGFDAASVFGLLFLVGILGLVVNTLTNVAEQAVSKNFSGN